MKPVRGKWRVEPYFEPEVFLYTKTPGPTSPSVTASSTALDLFTRFFPQEAWELLVEETNRFAATTLSHTPTSRPWRRDTTVEEMKAFVGLLMMMGVVRSARLELYWEHTSFPLIETPGIARVMTLLRFEQLFRCFHLANNAPFSQPGHDKLYKVRSLLDIVLCRGISSG